MGKALAIGALAALAAAGPARAASDVTIGFTQTFTVSPGNFNGAVTGCPEGETALSGGVIQSGSPDDLDLRVSGPVSDFANAESGAKNGDTPRGWIGVVSTGSTTKTVRLFVVCAHENATLAVTKFGSSAGSAKRKTVKCPGSRRAVGGGLTQAINPGFDYLRESGPVTKSGKFKDVKTGAVPAGWRVSLASQEGGDTYRAMAVCAKKSKAELKVATRKPSAPNFGLDAEAICPGNKLLQGGGLLYDGSPALGYAMGASGPLDSSDTTLETDMGDIPILWYASVGTTGTGPISGPYKVAAICQV